MKLLIVVTTAIAFMPCFGGCQNGTKNMKPPKQSQLKGMTENLVLRAQGKPTETRLHENGKSLIGEIRTPVARDALKMDPSSTSNIKELVYARQDSTLFVWLMQISNEWVVFSDLEVPKGVRY